MIQSTINIRCRIITRNLLCRNPCNCNSLFRYTFNNTIGSDYTIICYSNISYNFREPLNNRLYLVSTQCISRHLRLAEVISAQNSHYLSTFLLRFPKKGRLPLCQVVESFRPAIASAYKLAQANIAYSRFSFFLSPRYTVFL